MSDQISSAPTPDLTRSLLEEKLPRLGLSIPVGMQLNYMLANKTVVRNKFPSYDKLLIEIDAEKKCKCEVPFNAEYLRLFFALVRHLNLKNPELVFGQNIFKLLLTYDAQSLACFEYMQPNDTSSPFMNNILCIDLKQLDPSYVSGKTFIGTIERLGTDTYHNLSAACSSVWSNLPAIRSGSNVPSNVQSNVPSNVPSEPETNVQTEVKPETESEVEPKTVSKSEPETIITSTDDSFRTKLTYFSYGAVVSAGAAAVVGMRFFRG